jgi:hypothetical protein
MGWAKRKPRRRVQLGAFIMSVFDGFRADPRLRTNTISQVYSAQVYKLRCIVPLDELYIHLSPVACCRLSFLPDIGVIRPVPSRMFMGALPNPVHNAEMMEFRASRSATRQRQ